MSARRTDAPARIAPR